VSCVSTIAELRAILADVRNGGAEPIGMVPTMGALHEGHLSLIRRARAECGYVVVSIFVNPTQFGPQEDFARYPRDLDKDLALSLGAGADLVFAPADVEMYLPGHSTWVDVEGLSEGLCGVARPGHFRGVCTVVAKLLNLCDPDRAYFGQKDAQQLAVIRRMVRDLNMGADIVGCAIVREADGLAMSSRNVYLSPEQRAQAPLLRKALLVAEESIARGERDAAVIQNAVRVVLDGADLGEVEYVVVVNAEDLEPVESIAGECLVAIAVRFGRTRLIDNTLVRG
jgi:pantoate--beta-alanine ligase